MKKRIGIIALIICGLIACLGLTISVNAEDIEEPKEEVVEEVDWFDKLVKEYLSAEKVAMYMSWIAYIGTIIGLVANLNKLKKSNSLTLEKVQNMITVTMQELVNNSVTENVEKFLPNIVATQDKTNDILKTFSKILALAQENSPESRVAILHLIEELGTTSKEVIDNTKEAINKEVALIEEHKEEINTKLDEIINNYNVAEEYDGTSI